MGSHSVTCHPTEVRIPPLAPAEARTRFSDPKGCKAELTYVTWKRTGRELSPQPINGKSNTLPLSHHATWKTAKPSKIKARSINANGRQTRTWDLAACTKSVSMVSDKSGTMSANTKSTLWCRVWPCDEGARCLSPTPTLGSKPTLEPRGCMSATDTDTGELTSLEVSGVSGKYGDLTVDTTGLWSVLSSAPTSPFTLLTHTSQTCHNTDVTRSVRCQRSTLLDCGQCCPVRRHHLSHC